MAELESAVDRLKETLKEEQLSNEKLEESMCSRESAQKTAKKGSGPETDNFDKSNRSKDPKDNSPNLVSNAPPEKPSEKNEITKESINKTAPEKDPSHIATFEDFQKSQKTEEWADANDSEIEKKETGVESASNL